ncbi:MAG: ornithine--oxo-acid transaminase [Candidatus Yanofskybacteria bacterium RIFCSPHIGHO2_01_FULL_43_42]|uniref:ornithine aminotransferase n=1 Tax=Candidatus Yanofskybacteria bacterium RIFCSPLOWO2_01_FULL_43_22 TaxID=1802695 RepID=A0A1F8GGD5_9BACT|nr:MAG: ornithine--oxo-acid transaminase [Candidatus Yanofskybacteria bacterium RIFCSPHIGHO2_01_FULL_43_42]OGN12416.1 MAG: ornithine--oxo-acid transaminase [Candidatus Yanofskybacteria bacterium RIFCSPHIGHO2_02_FULL_43_17]OGN23788.1 MAG: ornithine--oxo-acid transaminase [Candidatus Yanofskybacteria bacterium RIFCSPLOWO2_01_FULL_43_22]
MEREFTKAELLKLYDAHVAHNYKPFSGFIGRSGKGSWVQDVSGKKYLDMLSSYSALSFGHAHPRILRALIEQACRLPNLPGAFYSEEKMIFSYELARFCGMEMSLIMNTGAEAVETALKLARKWAYKKKKIKRDRAEIIVCGGNFHGRTITIVSFSTEPQYKNNFGPHTPGFKVVPFGDVQALKDAITPNTAAFLVEPIQGEGGINVPPVGYLRACRKVCTENNVLLMADEIQTGLARTGKMFACNYEDVKPDVLILGKALGGGFMPVSAVVGSRELLMTIKPADHGSTFGGNPLGCHVARESLRVLVDEHLVDRAFNLGRDFMNDLKDMRSPCVKEVRGRGLMIGVVIKEGGPNAHKLSQRLVRNGMLCKEARTDVIRLAPPLTITREELHWGLELLKKALL